MGNGIYKPLGTDTALSRGRDYSLGASRPLIPSRTPSDRQDAPQSNRSIKPRFVSWDIVLVTGPNDIDHPKYQLYRPLILASNLYNDVEAERLSVTFEDDGFLPAEDMWLVAESTADPWTTYEVKLLSGDWDDFPQAYYFVDDELDTVRIPLWRFFSTDDSDIPGGRVKLGASDDPVYGEKLVGDTPIRFTYGLLNVPSTIHYRTVPYFSF